MLQPKKKQNKRKKKSDNPADSYPPMKDETGAPLIGGGEGTTPPFTRKEMEYKKKMTGLPRGKMGKTISKAKNGKSFPDLNKDGKITKADILKGRGVIAKNGKPVKKAFLGALAPLAMKALPMLGGMLGGGGGGGKGGGGGGIGGMLGGLLGGKNGKTVKKSKSGSTMKKAMNGYGGKAASMVPMKKGGTVKAKMGASVKKAQTGNAIIDKASKDYKSYSAGTGPKPPLSSGFKNGGSTKKCKYGCK